MRVLPGVVVGVVAVGLVTGCSKFDAALGQQQATVSFNSGVSNATRLKIRATCAKVQNVQTTPVANLKKYPYALSVVIYNVSNASDANIAELEECLGKFKNAVSGVAMSDSSDEGSLPIGYVT
jgi:hypothetical protein